MGLTGYPDWQRIDYATGFQIFSQVAAVTAFQSTATFNVTPWQSIFMNLHTGGAADTYAVALTFFQDLAHTQQVGFQDVIIGPGSEINIAIPVQGPFMNIAINPLVGGNNTVIQVYFYGIGRQASCFDLSSYITPLLFDSSSYLASQQKTFVLARQHYGKAHLNISRSLTGGFSANVQYFDFSAAAWNAIGYFPVTGNGNVDNDMAFPAAPIRVVISNGTTAQTLATALVASP